MPTDQVYTYTIHLEPSEEGGYVVTVPALPGCVTEGDSYQDAVAMAREAIEGFIEALTKAGEPIPVEPPPRGAIDAVVQIKATVAA